ncbi:MAG: autotransporter-associated beta strand repeat-containing protein [Kiritimatiellae bacterium]|nr:autotransporter-associated beta strand repeat-containing protein [Kiritimatiellia bacterium]
MNKTLTGITVAPLTRLFTLGLCIFAIGHAWAAVKPLAVWNGDFVDNSERGGFTFTINGNEQLGVDGVKMGSSNALKFDYDITATRVYNTGTKAYPISIVAAMSNIVVTASTPESTRTLFSISQFASSAANQSVKANFYSFSLNPKSSTGYYLGGDGNLTRVTGTSSYAPVNVFDNADTWHYMAMKHSGNVGTRGCEISAGNNFRELVYDSTLKWGTNDGWGYWGLTVGGAGTANNNCTDAVVRYVALIQSDADTDVEAWSLRNMTRAETLTSSSTSFTGGDNVGVNFNGGTITVASAQTAAALFVQESTTIAINGSGKITTTANGPYQGPLYIADGKTLTVTTDKATEANLRSAFDASLGTGTITLIDAPVYGTVDLSNITSSLPTIDGYTIVATSDENGVRIVMSLNGVNYTGTVTGEATWADKTNISSTDTWANSPSSTITLCNEAEASLTFDEDVNAESLTLNGTGKITLSRGNNVNVRIGDNTTAGKAIIVNTEAVLEDLGQDAAVRITGSNKATLKDYTAFPAGSTLPSTGTLRMESDTVTLTAFPCAGVNLAGTVEVDQSITLTGDGFYLYDNKPAVNIEGGTDSFSRFVLGNKSSYDNPTQTVTQNGGSITVTGTAEPTSTSATMLLGHWPSTSYLYTRGGTFSVPNAAVRMGWNGGATWEIGGGTGTATVTVPGILISKNGTAGRGTVNVAAKGTLNLGSYGLQMQSSAGTLNLSGGTIKATTDTTIANNKSDGTVLTASKETTIDTTSGNVTISAPLSGSGSLNVTGGGTLTITGSGTASGGTIKATDSTIVLSGNGAKPGDTMYSLKKASGSSTTAKLEIRPGEGNTITLAPTHIINSTDSGAQIIVGAGTTKIAHTQTNAGSGTFGGAVVKVEDGGTLEVNNINWTVENVTYGLEIGASSKFAVNALSTNCRPITMGEGATLEVSKGSSYSTTDGALKLDFRNGNGFTVNGNATIQATGEDAETPFINMTGSAAQPFNVASEKTLSVNANIKGTSALTKTGAGKLALNGYGADSGYTYTGTTTVSAGTLEINATQTGSPYSLVAGSTLKFGTYASVTMPSIILPASGTAAIDVSALTIGENGVKLVTFATTAPTQADVDSKLTVTGGYALKVEDNALKAYPAVAQYNGKGYETVKAAIDAAVADGHTYADVTILDATAECPDGYYIDNGTLKKKPASITVGENVYYYTTIQAAVQDALPAPYGSHSNYDYLTIYESNTAVAMMDYTLKLATAPGVTGVTVSLPVSFTTTEYAVSSVSGDTYTTYSVSVNPKTYRWKNAAAGTLWTTPSNWEFQDNETWTSAQRYPGDGTTGDSVVVTGDTSIQLGNAVTLASLQVTDGALALAIPSQGTATTLTASEITLGANATISLTGVTLSQDPTSGVDLMYVKATNSDGTTTYSLQAAGTVEEGVAKITDATAEVTVPANATAIEAAPAVSSIKLADGSAITDSDVTVKYNGTTNITGAFSISVAGDQVTLALNANGSVTISDKTITVKPAVDTSADPMTMPDETTAPSFNIKTIPGLYYVVRSGTSPNSLAAGSATQATTTTTGLAGPALGNKDTVRYYKISVGRTAAEAAQ